MGAKTKVLRLYFSSVYIYYIYIIYIYIYIYIYSHSKQRGGRQKKLPDGSGLRGESSGGSRMPLGHRPSMISLGRVAMTRVSVVRPKTPSDSWKQH